jgi:hypothetical protein
MICSVSPSGLNLSGYFALLNVGFLSFLICLY